MKNRRIEVVDDTVARILSSKTETERLQIAFQMHHSAKILLKGFISSLHPDWDEKTVMKEVARRFLWSSTNS